MINQNLQMKKINKYNKKLHNLKKKNKNLKIN